MFDKILNTCILGVSNLRSSALPNPHVVICNVVYEIGGGCRNMQCCI